MYRPCQHIIIFQIMIDMAKLHPILIYKHEMDLKLYALAFKVGKCITKMFLFFQIWFDYKFKYITKILYNNFFSYLNKRSSQK
jgi:hypothetical protein